MTTKTEHATEPATKKEWMRADPQRARISKRMLWAGRAAIAVPVLMPLFSGTLKLAKPALVVEEFTRLGHAETVPLCIGILELACTVVYAIPRTAILGAILLTGYLGGATATHVRIGDSFFAPVLVGALVWLGLFLRDERLRELIPWRSARAERSGQDVAARQQ